jgi:hypothetical protein
MTAEGHVSINVLELISVILVAAPVTSLVCFLALMRDDINIFFPDALPAQHSPVPRGKGCSSLHAALRALEPRHPLARLRQAPLSIDMTPPVRVRLVDRRSLEAKLYTPQHPALPRALLDILPPNRPGLRDGRPRVCIITPRYAPLH